MLATRLLNSVSSLTTDYDLFILDLWGVIHDGQHLYPEVKQCLEQLRKNGKNIVFLSNAPRRAHIVAEMLLHMGINSDLYDKIVTSGEVFHQSLAHPEQSFFKPHGRNYFYIGMQRDQNILDGLHYEEVKQPESAQFVMLSHSYYDNQPISELIPVLQNCVRHKLPLLCVNPDKEVVSLSGEYVYCAGVIAEEYRMMGGETTYFGKPYHAVYEASLSGFEHIDKKRIIAVGDGLKTDIAGAINTGIKNVLVTGGIIKEVIGDHKAEGYNENLLQFLDEEQIKPDFIIPAFNW